MSSHPLTIKGLVEFREALSKLPQELANEATDIVHDAATGAMGETYVGYPRRTGTLRQGLTIEFNKTAAVTSATVKSTAAYAGDYESGTGPRSTRRGWNRGSMPAAKPGTGLIPTAKKWRRRMLEDLIGMLERAGFEIERS